jgi:Kef-type K+ transport system membrane component KefB
MLCRLALGKAAAASGARGLPQPSRSAAAGKAADPGQSPDLDVLTDRRPIAYVKGAVSGPCGSFWIELISSAMLDIAFVLLVIAALLVVVGLCQPLAAYLRLPPPVLLGVVGVGLGVFPAVMSQLGWPIQTDPLADIFVALPFSSASFIYVFLPLLVFEAGIVTDVRRMLQDAGPILLLAVLATLITTGAVGLALWPISGVSLIACLLLGAVVATTDPAAVIAIFRDIGAPARLTRLVEGEAQLNDAAAIALFTVLLGIVVSGREPDIGAGLREFFSSFIGGGLLGLLAGRLSLSIIHWLRDDRLAKATLTVALAYSVFVVAERLFHVSGIVAVLGTGLAVSALGRSRIAPYNWSFLADLWDQIAFLGPLAGVRPCLDPRSTAARRHRHPRTASTRCADSGGIRRAHSGAVRPDATTRILQIVTADQCRVQVGDHVGRIARGIDPGARARCYRKHGARP